MKILAIEQSTPRGSAALLDSGKVVEERSWTCGRLRSQDLFFVVQELLASASFVFGDVDLFAVDTGPGGFSSLRISVAATRGLALPLHKPVLGITCGEILSLQAAAMRETFRVTVFGDARRDRLWWASFEVNGSNVRATDPYALVPRGKAADVMAPGTCVVTSEWDRVGDTLLESAPPETHLIRKSCVPTAAVLAKIAATRPADATADPREPVTPIYLHPPVFIEPQYPPRHS